MQSPRALRFLVIAASLFALCGSTLRATIIFGNLAAYTNDNGQGGVGSQTNTDANGNYLGKSISFLMGATAYSVSDVVLRLANVNDTPGVDVPTVSIYTAGPGTTSVPSTLVGTFTNPSFTAGTAAGQYTFTAASSITLNANTRYALVVQQLNVVTNTVEEFNWLNGGTTVMPTSVGGIASVISAQFGQSTSTSNPSQMTSTSSQYNWFQIDGSVSAIPEPSTYAILFGLTALGFAIQRRSSRRTR